MGPEDLKCIINQGTNLLNGYVPSTLSIELQQKADRKLAVHQTKIGFQQGAKCSLADQSSRTEAWKSLLIFKEVTLGHLAPKCQHNSLEGKQPADFSALSYAGKLVFSS